VKQPTPDAPPERRRVLIVDDDPTMVHVLARTLMDCAQLYFSVRGEDALKKLDAHQPDLMLIDVDMPDLSGYEVMRRMLKNPRTCNTQVIMVTSHTEESYRRQAMELGAVDFFHKPVNRAEIRERVDQLINQEVESIELSFSVHGDFTSKTGMLTDGHVQPQDRSARAGQRDFEPTDILDQFTTPLPLLDTPLAQPKRKAPPPAKPARDSDGITSELFERMSAILEQTESIRHTDQKSLTPAVSQRIARIEEECAEVIQLLVTLSDGGQS
jgi:CheY-like chemotaxis protein